MYAENRGWAFWHSGYIIIAVNWQFSTKWGEGFVFKVYPSLLCLLSVLCKFFLCHRWADRWVICYVKGGFVKRVFYCTCFQVFKTLQCQLAAAQQSSHSENTLNSSSCEASASSTANTPSLAVMDKRLLTASMLLEKVDNATGCYSGTAEKLIECCICLERKPDVMLPCAHSYCMPCIEQWWVIVIQ